ncbi:MAG TPA: hypothetical protein DIT01_22495 [Lentisphaeria bacterium]|nr:hypothetical protein [Lentisphaeria bacterium]
MLQAGFAKCAITPPPGLRMGGYRRRREPASGVHDPLTANCLVVSDGQQRVAFVVLDLISLFADTVAAIKTAVAEATGMDAAQCLVTCTHTHSGPDTIFLSGGGEAVTAWCRGLPRTVAALVQQAIAVQRPVQVSVSRCAIDDVAWNRRLLMRDGTVRLNLEAVNPAEIKARGPVDPTATIVVFEDGETVVGMLVNFTLHPAVLGEENLMYSRDFPGVAVDAIRNRHPDQPQVLFLNGAFGDINHVKTPGEWIATFAEAERIGNRIAEAVVPAIGRRCRVAAEPLSVTRKMVALERRPAPFADIEAANREIERLTDALREAPAPEAAALRYELSFAEETRDVMMANDACVAEIQVIRMGGIEVIGVPGELFVEDGLDLKRADPQRHSLIAGNANGYIGYLPLARSFAEGAYETRFGRTSCLVPEAGSIVVDEINRLRGLK